MSEKAVETEFKEGSIRTLEIAGVDLSGDIDYVYQGHISYSRSKRVFKNCQ